MYAIGLDIGNATTEAVLAGVTGTGIEVVGCDRVPTRGPKGSPASLDAACRLVRRLERAYGCRVGTVVAAPLRPVSTMSAALPERTVSTGRLRLAAAGSGTAGGQGTGVGPPYLAGRSGTGVPPGRPVVAVVPAHLPYQDALGELRALGGAGLLTAVVTARDEAVLLANRLGVAVPVVDEVPSAEVVRADLLAVEVRGAGQPLRVCTDPLRLCAALGLPDSERPDAVRLAGLLYDRSNAVVALDRSAPVPVAADGAWVTVHSGEQRDLGTEPPGPPGWARAYGLPGSAPRPVDDLYTVDLGLLSDDVLARVGSLHSRTLVLAALHADAPYTDPAAELSRRLGVPAYTVDSEAYAARLGGLSTPGTVADTAVVDLGGGTVDVVTDAGTAVVAGAGDLVTVGTAALLGATRAAAEWAKRGPAYRVEGVRVLLGEDGSRTFLDRPVGNDAIGALVTTGPSGWLPFDRRHAPSEWRALRLRLKSRVLGANLARALRSLAPVPSTVVVVGGPAGDDEVLACVARALPAGTAVGRGNAAGVLGHRHVVAYGLLLAWYARTVG